MYGKAIDCGTTQCEGHWSICLHFLKWRKSCFDFTYKRLVGFIDIFFFCNKTNYKNFSHLILHWSLLSSQLEFPLGVTAA